MAQSLRTTKVLIGGTAGLQNITITGFGTVIGAIFDFGVSTLENTSQTTDRNSYGFTDGTRQNVVAYANTGGVTTSDTGRIIRNDAVIVEISGAGSTVVQVSFDSFVTDGVRVNVTTSDVDNYCIVTLIGGDATNVYTNVTPSLGTIAQTNTISTVGFLADIVLSGTVGLNTVNAFATQTLLSQGMAVNDGSDFNAMVAVFDQDAQVTMNTGQYVSSVYSMGQYFIDALGWGGTINNYTASGFDIVTNAGAGADFAIYIAIKFSNSFVKAAIEDSPTATGTKSFGATSSTPNFLMMLGSGADMLATTTSGLNFTSLYADDTNQECYTHYSEDNVGTSSNGKLTKAGGFRQLTSAGAAQFDSTFTAFTATGADFSFTTVDATARKFITLFVGEVGGGTAVASGTLVPTVTEADIVTGGKTLILTLTGDTFLAAGTGPIGTTANTQAIIDGISAAASPTNGWNNEVRDTMATSIVVRTSDTVATLTYTAVATYDIATTETITATIPAQALTGGVAIVATPTFTVSAVAVGGSILLLNRSIANYQGIRQ